METTTTVQRGIRCYIYVNAALGQSSNYGVSSRCKEVTLIGAGIPEQSAVTDYAPAVQLVSRHLFGNERPYVTIQPVVQPEGQVGPMFGGCYIGGGSTAFEKVTGSRNLIPFHDRFETPEQYRELSR